MAARDVVLRFLSTFDASGVEAAQKGTQGVVTSQETLLRSTNRASESTRTQTAGLVDFEAKGRRVENLTRGMGTQLLGMAQAGFSTQGAASAAATAVGFLGNAVRVASGPLGAAITISATLASMFLAQSANAKEATSAVKELATETEVYGKALDILTRLGRGETDETVKGLKARQTAIEVAQKAEEIRAAESQSQLDAAIAQNKLNDAKDAETEINARLLPLQRQVAEGHREVQPLVDATRQALFKQQAEVIRLEAALNKLVATNKAHKEAVAALPAVLEDITEPADARIAQIAVETAGIEGLNAAYDALDRDVIEGEKKRQAEFRKTAREKMATEAMMVAAVSSSLESVAALAEESGTKQFGIAKALRYAAAVINTAAAVTGALAQVAYGVPYPVAVAMAISAGLAGAVQIATIASASPSGGGGATSPSIGTSFGGGGTSTPALAGAPGIPTVGGGGGGGIGPVTVSIENLHFFGLDPDSIPAGQLRRFANRIGDILLERINGLGGRLAGS